MRKQEPGLWVDRWSPRREQITISDHHHDNDDASAAFNGHGQPVVSFPSDDDDDTD